MLRLVLYFLQLSLRVVEFQTSVIADSQDENNKNINIRLHN